VWSDVTIRGDCGATYQRQIGVPEEQHHLLLALVLAGQGVHRPLADRLHQPPLSPEYVTRNGLLEHVDQRQAHYSVINLANLLILFNKFDKYKKVCNESSVTKVLGRNHRLF